MVACAEGVVDGITTAMTETRPAYWIRCFVCRCGWEHTVDESSGDSLDAVRFHYMNCLQAKTTHGAS